MHQSEGMAETTRPKRPDPVSFQPFAHLRMDFVRNISTPSEPFLPNPFYLCTQAKLEQPFFLRGYQRPSGDNPHSLTSAFVFLHTFILCTLALSYCP